MATAPSDWSRAQWRKSSYSANGGNCIEVATNVPSVVAIRDSKDPSGPNLAVSSTDWAAFLERIRSAQS
jgi:hypothetical protein